MLYAYEVNAINIAWSPMLQLELTNGLQWRNSYRSSYMKHITDLNVIYVDIFFRSHRLFRAFFIPFVSRHYVSYVNYNILVSVSSNKLLRI